MLNLGGVVVELVFLEDIRSSRRSSGCDLLMFLDQAFSTSPSPNCQNVSAGTLPAVRTTIAMSSGS